ncbi:PREDICTED: uncharacterized protein LOC105559964 isoform X2 [Vollenhovia emeryi]|uniref:uncharacterized protein LOC105559964 isoform X2 n=1 Tax=Vollenhovia emeryi TaxID=411798 RepID=UPI0005F41BBF|nr:PREDICTED: uncharacterized protein LOC105559964 isoform X2 [Vollenhovia emeryi]
MDFIGRRYYKINKFALNFLGLWPSQAKTKRIKIRVIFIYTMCLTFLFFQLCTLVTSKYNLALVLKVFSHFLPSFIYTVKYNAYYINTKSVKLFMIEIQNDWNALNDKKEIEIIEKYAYFMHVFTGIIMLFTCTCLIGFIFVEFLPIILDIVVPLNVSRPHDAHVTTEYFIDREKYSVLIILHEVVTVSAGGLTMAATGTMIMAYAQHACSLMKIVCYRMEHVLNENMLQHSNPRIERIICNRIIHAVNLHKRALNGVASISLNLYRLLQPYMRHDITELFSTIILLLAHLVYMFMANYVGQVVINHNDDIFTTTCNVLWYIAPLPSQRMLLFLMHRMMKSLKLVVCSLFVASLEGFATLSTTALSYLTVLYSIK